MKSTLPKAKSQGVWVVLHTQSFLATTHDKQKAFIKLLRSTIKYFPCSECSVHAQDYIDRNPPRVGNNIRYSSAPAVFVYMFEFHNFVNRRLGKPLADFSTIYEYYKNLVAERNNQGSHRSPRCRGC